MAPLLQCSEGHEGKRVGFRQAHTQAVRLLGARSIPPTCTYYRTQKPRGVGVPGRSVGECVGVIGVKSPRAAKMVASVPS